MPKEDILQIRFGRVQMHGIALKESLKKGKENHVLDTTPSLSLRLLRNPCCHDDDDDDDNDNDNND